MKIATDCFLMRPSSSFFSESFSTFPTLAVVLSVYLKVSSFLSTPISSGEMSSLGEGPGEGLSACGEAGASSLGRSAFFAKRKAPSLNFTNSTSSSPLIPSCFMTSKGRYRMNLLFVL